MFNVMFALEFRLTPELPILDVLYLMCGIMKIEEPAAVLR